MPDADHLDPPRRVTARTLTLDDVARGLRGMPRTAAFLVRLPDGTLRRLCHVNWVGAGFVLSSTAVIMSILKERGELASGQGQQAVSILLLEYLMIVPLLAIVAFMGASAAGGEGDGVDLTAVLIALGAIALMIAAGRWLLDPFFALLARARNTEVLTAGALLVVLGATLLMEQSGLSMAMGAFLAGVMLSGSSYRHQIETDIDPFKGLLMGLFFLAVGMSLDLSVMATNW